MSGVRTAVILAGGLGTRLLPATKAVPKELLPVVDRPLIQYAVEEAVASGIERVVIVLSPGKAAIREHFSDWGRVIEALREQGKTDALELAEAPARLADIHFTVQERPLGIANAIATTRQLAGDDPFALLFPDDLIFAEPGVTAQLVERHQQAAGTVLAVEEVPQSEISNYGIVSAGADGSVTSIVEKPAPGTVDSNLAIVGRYVLAPTIFEHIDRLEPGRGGEYQVTDAIAAQVAAGEPVHAHRYSGERYDTGRPGGYLAAFVAAAMRRPDLRAEVEQAKAILDRLENP